CSASKCRCPTGQTNCSGTCVNLQDDKNNCGGCGMVCNGTKNCSGGVCK
ncbi:Stigma-specific protein, Stig1, partial [Haliangium sp. UPWRP_2]